MVTAVQRMSCIWNLPICLTRASRFLRLLSEDARFPRGFPASGPARSLGLATDCTPRDQFSSRARASATIPAPMPPGHGAESLLQRNTERAVLISSRPPARPPKSFHHDSITSRIKMGSAIHKEFIKLPEDSPSSPNLPRPAQRNTCGIGSGQVELLAPSGPGGRPIPSPPGRVARICPRTTYSPLRSEIRSLGPERPGSSERALLIVPARHLQSTTWFEPFRGLGICAPLEVGLIPAVLNDWITVAVRIE